MKNYPPLKLRVFADDITAFLIGSNKEVAEMAKKVMNKLKKEVERKELKLSVTEDGRKDKSKMIPSCGREIGRQCGNAWRRHENESQKGWG